MVGSYLSVAASIHCKSTKIKEACLDNYIANPDDTGDMSSKKSPVKKMLKYACTMCEAKFSKAQDLQNHRKEIHKAAYNI